MSNFTELPNEIFFLILSFLQQHEIKTTLFSLELISKTFYCQVKNYFDSTFWKEILENYYLKNKYYIYTEEDLKKLECLLPKIDSNRRLFLIIENYLIKNNIQTKNEKIDVGLFGSGGVGKTTICHRYIGYDWDMDYDRMLDDYLNKPITIGNKNYLLKLTDTLGQEEFWELRQEIYKYAQGFIFMCDICLFNTLSELKQHFEGVFNTLNNNNYPVILCVNKIDRKEEYQMNENIIDEFLNEMINSGYLLQKCKVFFTSAKTKEGLDDAFLEIATQITKKKISLVDLIEKIIVLEKKQKKKKCLLM
ncbi:hypothetical protein ABK040_013756 [Willaertia magna]